MKNKFGEEKTVSIFKINFDNDFELGIANRAVKPGYNWLIRVTDNRTVGIPFRTMNTLIRDGDLVYRDLNDDQVAIVKEILSNPDALRAKYPNLETGPRTENIDIMLATEIRERLGIK